MPRRHDSATLNIAGILVIRDRDRLKPCVLRQIGDRLFHHRTGGFADADQDISPNYRRQIVQMWAERQRGVCSIHRHREQLNRPLAHQKNA